MFAGLANRLGSVTFVLNLAVIYDALEELSELLQDRNMTLPGQMHVSLGKSVC